MDLTFENLAKEYGIVDGYDDLDQHNGTAQHSGEPSSSHYFHQPTGLSGQSFSDPDGVYASIEDAESQLQGHGRSELDQLDKDLAAFGTPDTSQSHIFVPSSSPRHVESEESSPIPQRPYLSFDRLGQKAPLQALSTNVKRPGSRSADPRMRKRPSAVTQPTACVQPCPNKSKLPPRFRALFPFERFNEMQNQVFPSIWNSEDNIVVSAPTGSGKTVLFELAICKMLDLVDASQLKILYMAPTRSLCAEKQAQWDSVFQPLGIRVALLTGETSQDEMRLVSKSTVMYPVTSLPDFLHHRVTTPEKWDSISRRWSDHRRLIEMVDEVHMLQDSRGATLEAVVSRMKAADTKIRIVAVSATAPNISDLALWIRKDNLDKTFSSSNKALSFYFNDDFRSVQLEKLVYGFVDKYDNDGTSQGFQFDSYLNYKLVPLITTHSPNKPVLIFCSTRGSAEKCAKQMASVFKAAAPENLPWQCSTEVPTFMDKNLNEYSACGTAFHTAGLSSHDRNLVEQCFREGKINVLCATTTLALGVNLPAFLVIVKGIARFSGKTFAQYSQSEIQQMIGRAGRPGLQEGGKAIVLTSKKHEARCRTLMENKEVIESKLHENLLEHLNAEIFLRTIRTSEDIVNWVKTTFLYVRARSSPEQYDIGGSDVSMNQRLQNLCLVSLEKLISFELVSLQDSQLKSTAYGEIMTKYYVAFETMCSIMSLGRGSTPRSVRVCEAHEFRQLRLRQGEKGLYNDIQKLPSIRYKLNGKVEETKDKVFLLCQLEPGAVDLSELDTNKYGRLLTNLRIEKEIFKQHIHRLGACIIDCSVHKKDAITARSSMEILYSMNAGCWSDKSTILLQLKGIGVGLMKKMVASNLRRFADILASDSGRIEAACARNPPFGSHILTQVQSIPVLYVKILKTAQKAIPNETVELRFDVRVRVDNCPNRGWQKFNTIHADIIVERSDGLLVSFRRTSIENLCKEKEFAQRVELTNASQTVLCHVLCEEIVGTQLKDELNPGIDPDIFPRSAHADGPYEDAEIEQLMSSVQEPGPASCRKRDTDEVSKEVCWTVEPVAVPSSVVSADYPNGNISCNHKCRNKAVCKHRCCQEGVEIKRPSNASRGHMINLNTDRKEAQEQSTMSTGRALEDQPVSVDPDDVASSSSPVRSLSELLGQNSRANTDAGSETQPAETCSADRPEKLASEPISSTSSLNKRQAPVRHDRFQSLLADLHDRTTGRGNSLGLHPTKKTAREANDYGGKPHLTNVSMSSESPVQKLNTKQKGASVTNSESPQSSFTPLNRSSATRKSEHQMRLGDIKKTGGLPSASQERGQRASIMELLGNSVKVKRN